ncbi:calcium-binding protein [Actinoplanes rectilineatus]|uniref:calcium-binding protein n=1 Tax=Actinoplanes rectilineatus TaxID=113571 RepID=UPI000696EAC8|nr:calcium-binding protein [Actinoplanes rectilineatus]
MTPRVHTSWLVRAGAVLLTTAAAGLLTGTPAEAASTGSAKTDGNVVTFTAGKGKTNKVTITRSGTTFTIDDRVKVKAGKGCKAVKGDSTRVKCKVNALNLGEPHVVKLGDGNDTLVNKSGQYLRAYGGTGRDKLTGGSSRDWLYGESGNDVLYGQGAADELHGGTGADQLHGGTHMDLLYGESGDDVLWGGRDDDQMFGGTGADEFHGESGRFDTVRYDDRTVPVIVSIGGRKGDDGAKGEHDTVHTDVEDIRGGTGDDRLTGGTASDHLYGGDGDDIIRGGDNDDGLIGGPGRDRIYGEAGNDQLLGFDAGSSRDPDLLDGGVGGDYCAFQETVDTVVNCEYADPH